MRRKKYGMKKYQQDVKDGEGGGGAWSWSVKSMAYSAQAHLMLQ